MIDTQQTDETFSFRTAFEADTELHEYGDNALSVFALTLYLRLDDPHEFAATAITEGPTTRRLTSATSTKSKDESSLPNPTGQAPGEDNLPQQTRQATWQLQSHGSSLRAKILSLPILE
jgi:hypothetical protein